MTVQLPEAALQVLDDRVTQAGPAVQDQAVHARQVRRIGQGECAAVADVVPEETQRLQAGQIRRRRDGLGPCIAEAVTSFIAPDAQRFQAARSKARSV